MPMRDEGRKGFRDPESKILGLEALCAVRETYRRQGKTFVFTNGCFDILHAGHVQYLSDARRLGDALAIGLNSDVSVKANKGPKRPIVPQQERARMLAALEMVDYVVLFDEKDPGRTVARLLPDILVKGADWAHLVIGREDVEKAGGKVVLVPLVEGLSTTNIISKIINAHQP
jgi:rfaE bifunctional protein nucleotidyltransferase chain/domain